MSQNADFTAAPPIVALWAHPRSMSTATERIMRERGDLDCAHEPFMYDYYVHRGAGQMPNFDVQPEHPTRYGDIRDMLLARAAKGCVFFKDMAYYVTPYMGDDAGFARRLRHVFLIRDPRAAIASYFKLDPAFTREEVGIEGQWRLYQILTAHGVRPLVIRSEDIRNDPKGMMRSLWAKLGLPDAPHAFDWAGDVPEDWAQVASWHAAAAASSGIRPMPPDHAERAAAAFEAAARLAPHLRDWLAHHQPFHDRLAALALRRQSVSPLT